MTSGRKLSIRLLKPDVSISLSFGAGAFIVKEGRGGGWKVETPAQQEDSNRMSRAYKLLTPVLQQAIIIHDRTE